MTTALLGLEAVEFVTIKDEDFFLDGPVSKRGAVLDFDPQSGDLLPGAKFRPPTGKQKFGVCEMKDEDTSQSGFDLAGDVFLLRRRVRGLKMNSHTTAPERPGRNGLR